MPQMGPLPWMSLWIVALGLSMMFLILIFYSTYYSMSMSSSIGVKENFKWKW